MVNYIAVALLVILLLIGGYHFDMEKAISFYGSKITPNHPSIGNFIFIGIFFVLIFLDNIISFIFKRPRYKIKGKF